MAIACELVVGGVAQHVCMNLKRKVSDFIALQQRARNYELKNLARTLVDPEHAGVAIEAFNRIIGHVAGAAEDLHSAIGNARYGLGTEILRGRGKISGIVSR